MLHCLFLLTLLAPRKRMMFPSSDELVLPLAMFLSIDRLSSCLLGLMISLGREPLFQVTPENYSSMSSARSTCPSPPGLLLPKNRAAYSTSSSFWSGLSFVKSFGCQEKLTLPLEMLTVSSCSHQSSWY